MRLNIEHLNFMAGLGAIKNSEPKEVKPKKKKRKKHKRRKIKVIEPPVVIALPVIRKKNQEWLDYRQLVWDITEAQDLTKLKHHEKRAFKGYHLDHKVSIWYGFRNKLDPKLIGGIQNLEFIHWKDNSLKGVRCNFKDAKCLQAVLFY